MFFLGEFHSLCDDFCFCRFREDYNVACVVVLREVEGDGRMFVLLRFISLTIIDLDEEFRRVQRDIRLVGDMRLPCCYLKGRSSPWVKECDLANSFVVRNDC